MALEKMDEDVSKKLESLKDRVFDAVVGHLGDCAILIILEIDGNVLDFSNLDYDDHIGLLDSVLKSHERGGVIKKKTEYLAS